MKLTRLFDIIITREDTEKSKPGPMPYTFCFSKLNLKSDEAVLFEDSVVGLAAANAASRNVFKVEWY